MAQTLEIIHGVLRCEGITLKCFETNTTTAEKSQLTCILKLTTQNWRGRLGAIKSDDIKTK